MRPGWKNRIEERRYFEEKKDEWRKRCVQVAMLQLQHQMQVEEVERLQRGELLRRPLTTLEYQ